MPDRQPAADELAAWREFLRAHNRIVRALEADLLDQQQLPLAWYDVLVQLAEATERRLRMTDLAEALLLSRSGVTRLVDRMQGEGLVHRSRVVGDGRGVVAVLTPAGLARLRAASDVHLAGVARYFADQLDDDQLATLRALCGALAGPVLSPSRPAEPVPDAHPANRDRRRADVRHGSPSGTPPADREGG